MRTILALVLLFVTAPLFGDINVSKYVRQVEVTDYVRDVEEVYTTVDEVVDLPIAHSQTLEDYLNGS